MKLTILYTLGSLAFSLGSLAQDHRMQIHGRGGILTTNSEASNSNTVNANYTVFEIESFVFVVPKVGIGVTYATGIHGSVTDEARVTARGEYQHIGLSGMVTTDRTRRFSGYGTVGIQKAQQALTFANFETGQKGVAYTIGFGATVKINRMISLNLIDAGYVMYGSGFQFSNGGPAYGLQLKAGLIFKLLRMK